jgi:predicted aspartyl protease
MALHVRSADPFKLPPKGIAMELRPPCSALLTALIVATALPAVAAEIALRVVASRPLVDVHLNDSAVPLTFILDTAAGSGVIDTATAARLQLTKKSDGSTAQVQGAAGKAANYQIIPIQRVRLGSSEQAGLRMIVTDMSRLNRAKTGSIDGILGNDFLKPYWSHFDFGAGRLTLRTTAPAARTGCLPNRRANRPELGGFGIIEVEVAANGGKRASAMAIIDTGSAVTILNPALAHQLGVADLSTLPLQAGQAQGLAHGLSAEARIFPLEQLRLGPASVRQLDARAVDFPVFHALSLGDTPAVILGMDALATLPFSMTPGATELCF